MPGAFTLGEVKTCARVPALLVAAALSICAGGSGAEDEPARDRATTESLVRYYRGTKHWALRGLVLLSFGSHWHPVGREAVLDALRSRNLLLRACAVETLLRTERRPLRAILSEQLVGELIRGQLAVPNDRYRQHVMRLLDHAFPEVGVRTRSEWNRWWFWIRGSFIVPRWRPPALRERSGRTVALPFIRRAFDLYQAGLDLVICIDSTGSMQPTIDLARDAIHRIVASLRTVAPKLRVGLVHYRDLPDMPGGAQVLVTLTSNSKVMRDALARLQAMGGGDRPERVEKGLELALGRAMGWKRSTNKVVLLVGDSPPHPEALGPAKELARRAYTRPFGKPARPPAPENPSGRKTTTRARPFVTSAISVGPWTEKEFRAIAEAGGGAWAMLPVDGDPDRTEASDQIVSHILTLAYGSRWARQLDAFVKILCTYREPDLR
ncbi:MAG: vWA domain-containing protein [Planctomycetota bacterium]